MTGEHAAGGPRDALLVGSIPGRCAREAMGLAVDTLGPYLRALPDGETGDRSRWVAGTVDAMRALPSLRVARDGDWSGYRRRPRLAVRHGHRLRAADIPLGYADAWSHSREAYRELRPRAGHPVPFQVGLPSPLDLALLALGAAGAARHRGAFLDAAAREVHTISAAADHEVVFQVEMPVELALVARAPRAAQRALATRLARGVVALVERSPVGSRWGLHLCLGDLGHRALATPRDARPATLLANALTRTWPADRSLAWLHVPLAAGDQPPPLAPGRYAPLRDLSPGAARVLVAGLVHERCSEGQLREVLAVVEDAVGRRVGVAAPCGLGRRDPATAQELMERTAHLCLADWA